MKKFVTLAKIYLSLYLSISPCTSFAKTKNTKNNKKRASKTSSKTKRFQKSSSSNISNKNSSNLIDETNTKDISTEQIQEIINQEEIKIISEPIQPPQQEITPEIVPEITPIPQITTQSKIKEFDTTDLKNKIEKVQSSCSGIKSSLDTIFGLSVATTVSSGLGTLASGGALATGLMKTQTDKKIQEGKGNQQHKCDIDTSPELDRESKQFVQTRDNLTKKWNETKEDDFRKRIEIAKEIKFAFEDFRANKLAYRNLFEAINNSDTLLKEIDEEPDYNKKIEKFEFINSETNIFLLNLSKQDEENYKTRCTNDNSDTKKSIVLGNVRTGLMAGATLTSAISTGTSIGSTLTATKLAEKMSSCNSDLKALKIAKATAEAEEVPDTNPAVQKATKILSACTGYDENNIKSLKNLTIANSIVSGIGTVAAGAGTVTSAMANSQKIREGSAKDSSILIYSTDKSKTNDEEGDKKQGGMSKEKKLNLASNILAGVTLGTSATSTTLSAVQISKAKKDSEMAEKCESAL